MPLTSRKSPFEASILLTGGAGYLGRGLLRYCERQRIGIRATVYSRDEQKHYALRSRFPYVQTVLGDIRDTERLAATMAGHDIVIHMAAMKHVPEGERDVSVTYEINVEGSRSVARAAMRAGVKQVVGISTDKVTSPRNVYGATKMLMERTFQEAQRLAPHMRFTNVRYGNVVSSTGSVIPLFLNQMQREGRVTITSPEMTRFWVSIDDAVKLIEKALSDDSRRGYTYVLRCAGMNIVDVARAAVQYDEGARRDLDYSIIGVRPGEKLHETLVDLYEAPFAMQDGHYILVPPSLSMHGEGTSGLMDYTSSNPAHWLGTDEMVELIKDSATV